MFVLYRCCFIEKKRLVEQSERGVDYMNSFVKHEYHIILQLYHSVGGQRLSTIVDTTEQLLLEGSQYRCGQSQWN